MKKLVLNISIFIILILMSTNVQAKTSLNANVSSLEEDVKVGQTVSIKLKLDEYQEVEKGINSYKAMLEYDKDVFEEVKQSNFTTLNDWEQFHYNQETGEFIAVKRVGSKTPEEVVQINLEVKEEAEAQKTEVKIKEIVTSEGKEDLFVQETKADINIVKEQKQPDNNPENPGTTNPELPPIGSNGEGTAGGTLQKPSNNNVGNGATGSTSQNPSDKDEEEKADKIATTKLPKTGGQRVTIAMIIIFAIEILIIIAYINRKKEKQIDKEINKRKKQILTVLVAGIISFQAIGTIYATVSNFGLKGEVNDDGEINYADVDLIELHLVNLKYLPEVKLYNADINGDGYITVTDLTLLIRKIEKTLDYEVSLSDIDQENYYPNKNEEITLKFDGEVSYGATIKKAVINGQECEVQKTEGSSNEYTFKTNSGEISGIKEYHFTEVILDNGKKVKVNYTIKIDVLKQAPTLENYVAEKDNDEIKMKLSFDIVDKDDSIEEAILEIINEEDVVIQSENLKKGKNNIDVPMENGKEYKANFILRYDLDTNQLPQEAEHIRGEYIIKELQIIVDYDFKISNIITKNQETQTTTFEKAQPIKLTFESSNVTKFEPTTIKVNGKEYNVTKENEKYLATIDGITETGETDLVIEEVILENGEKFTLENDNKVTINVIKAKPAVSELTIEENIEENNMKVSFKLTDEDKAIKSASIILLDGAGVEIQRQALTEEEIQNAGTIEKTLTTQITDKYTVKIMATYNQTGVETEDIVDAILLEDIVKAKARTNIVEVTCNKEYPEKGETVTLTYEINTNKTEDISKIRVNSTDCQVTKLENGKYQVTLEVSETSGIQELTATKIIYSDEEMADVNKTVKVDVLKTKPTSEKFSQSDDINNRSVTLTANIIDPDGAFISGKAVLVKNSDPSTPVASKNFDAEHVTFTIEGVELDTEYTMYAYMTYDLDTNRIDNEPQQENYTDNYVEDEQFRERPIQLIADYELKVNNIKTYNEETESKYFEKGKDVTISFDCTNKIAEFYPVKAIINGNEYELERQGKSI